MSDQFREELIEGIRSLRAFARTFHQDAARAEDLVQETMLKAWSKREQFQEGTNMRAWLFTILRNTYLSELRKKKREVEDAEGTLAAQLAEKPRQEGFVMLGDLKDALGKLSEDQREAIILVGASGFTYEEAGEIVGVAAGTIKSRVSRARAALADMMGEDSTDVEDKTLAGGANLGIDRAAQIV